MDPIARGAEINYLNPGSGWDTAMARFRFRRRLNSSPLIWFIPVAAFVALPFAPLIRSGGFLGRWVQLATMKRLCMANS